MAWTAPYTPAPNDMMTAAIWAPQVRDNLNELRGGGLAIGGQAAGRIPYASSATQLATSANFTFDGIGGLALTGSNVGVSFGPRDGSGTTFTFYNPTGDDLRLFNAANDILVISTGGLLTVNGSGPHLFGAGGAGAAQVGIDINGGSAANGGAFLRLSRNSVAINYIGFHSVIFGGGSNSNALSLYGGEADGVELYASHASGDARIYSRNALAVTFGASQTATFTGAINITSAGVTTTVQAGYFGTSSAHDLVLQTSNVTRGKWFAGGGFNWGGTTDPGATNFRVEGTSTLVGAVQSDNGITCGTTNQIILNATGILSIDLQGGAFGTGNKQGARVSIGANTSGGGAAGNLLLYGKGLGANYVWADASAAPGVLRISTVPPDEDGTPSDTSGSVVGAQTSWHAVKTNIFPTAISPAIALRAILDTPIYDFEYAGEGYQDADGRRASFTGYVGYDRRDWFLMNVGPQQMPALNEITIPGYYALAIKALEARIRELEGG